jgi:hypothetical protein
MKNIFVGSIAVIATLVLANSAFCQSIQEADAMVSGFVQDPALSSDPQNFAFNTGSIHELGHVDASTGKITNGLGNAAAEGTALARCEPGSVAVFAQIQSQVDGPAGSGAHAIAHATYNDILTFTTLGPVGALFTVNSHWNINGSITGTASTTFSGSGASAIGQANLEAWGSGIVGHNNETNALLLASAGEQINLLGDFKFQNNAPTSIPVTLSFVSGAPFNFQMELRAEAVGSTGNGDPAAIAFANGTSNFGHTLSWGGIDSVTDANGNPVTGWTITSDSGFDYTQPFVDVPEPSTFAFLAVALPGLLLASRYCRRNRIVAGGSVN